ncbi:MAG: ribosomal protein L3 glutamine methyltransferase [Halioglobus sp.]|jgi:ribosomal protein L3 glutamine methyltransferase
MNTDNSIYSAPTTVAEALQYANELLCNSDVYYGHGTDNPWDEAVQLVLSVAGLPVDSDDSVLSLPLSSEAEVRMKSLLEQRITQRIPLPYLLGRAFFAGLEFRCDQRAIVPRSPLAELILGQFQPWYTGEGPDQILDLCCGAGSIGLAAAHYLQDATVDLLDIDTQALGLARENTKLLGLEDRVNIIESNLLDSVPDTGYDLILSNPPYVDANDLASMPPEYHHEPELALSSGPDGLTLTHRILATSGALLSPEGLLIVEVGNSWNSLEEAYPTVPFTWVEFEQGGHGVFILTAQDLQDYSACWRS